MILSLNSDSNKFLVDIGSTGKSKTKAVTLGLARAIAYSLTLPPAEVSDIHEFYKTEMNMDVIRTVGRINEVCLLDIQAVMKEVEAFFIFRYQSAFDNGLFHAECGVGKGIRDIFKLYNVFSEDTLTYMKDASAEISVINNNFSKIISQFKKDI